MDIDDWYLSAIDESVDNLIAFNFEYLENGSHIGAFRDGSSVGVLRRFEHFLERCAKTQAEEIIRNFAQRDRRSRGADCAAYAGVRVRGVDSFRALKSAAFFLDHRSYVLDYGDITLGELTIAINQAVSEQTQPYKLRPAGNFKAETKRHIDRSLKKAIDNAKSRSAKADARAARSGSTRGGSTTRGGRKPGFAGDPFWLTSKKALQDELGKLEESAGPLERSGYAAGLKCALGLHSGHLSERARDQSFSDSNDPDDPISPMSQFRVLFLLDVELSPSASSPPTQPNIFSEGYANLFVARPGPPDVDASGEDSMRGRTVRLRNVRRHSHGDECMCGAPGLPEAVMPTQLAIEEAVKGKMGKIGSECLVAFADDLIYDLPDCEMIRNKNVI